MNLNENTVKNYKIKMSSSAIRELDGISNYIEEKSGAYYALKQVKAIRQKIDILRVFPNGGALSDKVFGYRRIKYRKYIIYYKVNEKRRLVKVDHIIHSARKWPWRA